MLVEVTLVWGFECCKAYMISTLNHRMRSLCEFVDMAQVSVGIKTFLEQDLKRTAEKRSGIGLLICA